LNKSEETSFQRNLRLPKMSREAALMLAIGNDGRQDDGLGWAFAQAVRAEGLFAGEMALRYQLQVEDAELIKDFETVLFVDAWKTNEEAPFFCAPCLAEATTSFSTHSLSPQALLHLCLTLYDAAPTAYQLGIRGASWELEMELSAAGRTNLHAALEAWQRKSVT
jgi:hydrogenase maturation protease